MIIVRDHAPRQDVTILRWGSVREREIGFTVYVERDGGVVKIDYDIIIRARARRSKRTDRCNDGIMLL